MKPVYFQKIQDSRSSAEEATSLQKGSVSMAVTLMFLVFSVLGLSMIFVSQIHLKAEAARKYSLLLEYASENGIKQGLAEVTAALGTEGLLKPLSEGRADDLRTDALQGGMMAAEEFFGWTFPRLSRETWNEMIWESKIECAQDKVETEESFFSAFYNLSIESEGRLSCFKPRKASGLDVSLRVLAGRLPLPCIPFLINKKMAPAEKEAFQKTNGISFRAPIDSDAMAQVEIQENPEIPKDASALVAKALDIRLFRPEDLNNATLRRAIGLEVSNDPVPEGVYLIHDDLGLGGIYIQGDVDEMIPAIDGGYQVICFRARGREWILKFSPAEARTLFITPETTWEYDSVPRGIIAVNGKIRSLGGGVIHPSGEIDFAPNEAVPSILLGVNLTIISSEGVTISNHLISQGISWKDGIPYVKDSGSQVIIYSTGRDFLDGSEQEGTISVAETAPQDLTIQGSLVAQGEGFLVEGRQKDVEVLGGIQAVGLASEGNTLHITPTACSDNPYLFENAPRTANPMLFVSHFKIREWKEY